MLFRRLPVLAAAAVLALLAGVGAASTTSPAEGFKEATKPRNWSFPRDHGRHDGFKIEWWYFTGNLADASGRRFGYQLTFFRTALEPKPTTRPSPWAMNDLYFAHAAISDLSTKTFVYKDRLERGRPGLAWASDQTLDVVLLNWSLSLKDGKIRLTARDKDLAIDLVCAGGRGPVLQGPGGVNRKGDQPGQASYYYSMTRLETAGTISVNGQPHPVRGRSWMDHEFSSNALASNQVGWDWMGLQLSGGDDLMIYRLRDKAGGTSYLSGTRITPDGRPHYLSASDIVLRGSDPWTSPRSGGAYPQRWNLRCTGLPELVVRSDMPGQELVTSSSTKVTYFEGACDVTDARGVPMGEGYLEMTGYAKSSE